MEPRAGTNGQATAEAEAMTALAVRPEAQVIVAEAPKGAAYWMEHFEQARTFCASLLKTGFLGQHIKTAEQAVMIMMAGDELGLPPTVAFRDLTVVHGRIGMYANLMTALVLRSGQAKYIKRIEVTEKRAVYETWRVGRPEPEPQYVFTIEDAERAGYAKQNPKYNSDPKAMLAARCKGILCNDVYSDVLRGMPTAEQLFDDGPRDVTPPRPTIVEGEIMPLQPKGAQSGAAGQAGGAAQAQQPAETAEAFERRILSAVLEANTIADIDKLGAEIAKRYPGKGKAPTAIGTPWNARKRWIQALLSAESPEKLEELYGALNDTYQGNPPPALLALHERREGELSAAEDAGSNAAGS